MENEAFTFVVCSHTGHSVETVYGSRKEAERKFNSMCAFADDSPAGNVVAYYCASVGGLVNSYTKP